MIRKKLKSKKGNSLIYGAIIVLAMLLIVAGVSEYFRLKTITAHIEDVLQTSVINVSVENYENTFSSNREGYVSGNLYSNGEWKETVDEGDIYKQMSELLGLEKEGGHYVKYSDGQVEYKLSNLQVKIKSPPLKANVENKFIAESTIDFEIPHSFGWDKLPPLKLKLKVNSEYMIMF